MVASCYTIKTMKKRLLPACMLAVYSAILIKVLVFKDLPVIEIDAVIFNFGGTQEGPANLVPFKTILPYLLGKKGFLIAFINLAGNILLLTPVGFIVPLVNLNMTWRKSLALAIAAGSVIEGMQVLLHVGIFDIDDIVLNALGVIFGYWAFIIFANKRRPVSPATIIIASFIVIAAAACCFVAVFQAHQLPARLQPVNVNSKADSVNREGRTVQAIDPCAGTGGTGQIIAVEDNNITIELHNATHIIINFTTRTMIRNAAGTVLKSQLKIGDRVTVVTDLNTTGGAIATTVLVCNDTGSQPAR